MNDPERWQRVKSLFQTLAERPDGEWDAALRGLEPADSEIAEEVRALLSAHREGGGLIAAALVRESENMAGRSPGTDRAGRRVGAYLLESCLGEGGMGEVWLASRADDAYRMKVAVKFVHGGLVTARGSERFRTEREALARLEHPNIVRLLDGGTDENGVPYLVMEYVDGEPIERFCESRALPLRERLRLFLQVCAAVEDAHRRLIVHRDIKPGNVLVTGDGAVKLLDFGIAKLLDPEPGSDPLTRTAIAPATPAFASPEQLSGAPVTTATDVYALGVLLHRLVTGRHPYELPSEHPAEVARIILDTPPTRPSQAVAASVPGVPGQGGLPLPSPAARRAWSRELRGDLDNMVRTALRKEPSRRYRSAALFALDVERYLDRLPVSATPDSLRYRAGKFVRRNRLAVAATGVAGLGLVALAGVAIREARSAERQTKVAVAEQKKAEAVSEFLVGVLGAANSTGALIGQKAGTDVRVADVLADASRRAGQQFSRQPDIAGRVHFAIGQSNLSLGLYEAARVQYQLAADEIFASHPVPDLERALALHGLARAQHLLGRTKEAESTYRRTLAEYDRLTDLPKAQRQAPMAARHDVALLLAQNGSYAEAEAMERKAISDVREKAGPHNPAEAIMLGLLAEIRSNRGDLAEAERLHRESQAAYAALPASTAGSPERGRGLTGLCAVLRLRGRLDEADATCEEARAVLERAVGRDHPFYSALLVQLGALSHERGLDRNAEELLTEALAAQRKRFPPGHIDLARTETSLGQVLSSLAKPRDGEVVLREALSIRRTKCPAGDWRVGETASALGEALARQGRHEDAAPLLREGYDTMRAALGETHPLSVLAAHRLEGKAADPPANSP